MNIAELIKESAGAGTLGPPDGKRTTLVALSVAGKAPIAQVSIAQARRACKNAGKRLCREKEWVAACKGMSRWAYPYGPQFEPRRCNDWEVSDHGMKGVVATGSFPKCVSPLGAFDLANNVGEWIDADDEKAVKTQFDVRGGTYNMVIVDSSCDEDDYRAPPDAQRPDIGFRCCR